MEQEDVTLDNIVSEAVESSGEQTKGQAESKEQSDTEDVKPDYKKSASDRIRQLNKKSSEAESRANAAESLVKTEIAELKNKLNEISERLKAGDISQKEANSETKKALEDLEISDDIKPYKDDIIKIASKIANMTISPYEKKIKEYESERLTARKEKQEMEKAEWGETLKSSYLEASKDFPDIFEEAEEGELPELKPEYDEKARNIAAQFNMPYQDENGNTVNYNPMLSSVQGLKMLFAYISGGSASVNKAKEKISKIAEGVADAKKSKVETPYSPKSAQKKETLSDIVNSTMKELAQHK